MADNKRIVKNSLLLYVRMAVTVIIALYTSRVLLRALGVDDFGVYTVVGGLAVVFSFFSNALSTTTQRFITVEIGKNSVEAVKRMFSTCLNCHILISFVVVVLAETIGLWFLNTQLNISPDRMTAANWVYQFGVMSLVLDIVNAPYIGFFIAYEKMDYFAVTSVVNAVLKLVIVFFVMNGTFDRLIYYAALLFGVYVVKWLMDRFYCHYRFADCRYVVNWDRQQFKEIFSFTGWNIFKNTAIIAVAQGSNILVNIFGGSVASAAIGIANQVNSQVYGFTQNIQTAFNPQITKTCGSADRSDFYSLIFNSAKYTSILLLVVAIPLILNMGYVLRLWLDVVPEGAMAFCVLSIVSVFIDSMTNPLNTGIMANGDIKRFQISTSVIWILAVPLALVMLYVGLPLYMVIVAKILAQMVVLIYVSVLLWKYTSFPYLTFCKQIVGPVVILFGGVYAFTFFISDIVGQSEVIRLIVTVLTSWICLLTITWMFMLSSSERSKIMKMMLRVVRR